jgi:hypothetical protein
MLLCWKRYDSLPRLNDVAVMGEPVEQRRGHLSFAEYVRPFGEAQVGDDDDTSVLVQFRQQLKQQCTAGD